MTTTLEYAPAVTAAPAAAPAAAPTPATEQAARRSFAAAASRSETEKQIAAAGLTAGLVLQIVLIHLIDQDWFAFAKGPSYVQTGYTMIEITGIITAAWLLIRRSWLAWGAAFGVAAGPLMGFILSRGPGLPNYTDDMGNWFEPLGVASVLVEVAVMAIAGAQLLRTFPALRLPRR